MLLSKPCRHTALDPLDRTAADPMFAGDLQHTLATLRQGRADSPLRLPVDRAAGGVVELRIEGKQSIEGMRPTAKIQSSSE
jgi:hypothetical protein